MHTRIALSLLLIGSGCAGAPRSATLTLAGAGDEVADSAEARLAASMLEARYGGLLHDPEAEAQLASIARHLAPACPEVPRDVRCLLLDSDERNAFSLPGRVYLTRALYRELDGTDLLAAAMAHEFAHLAHEDSLRPASITDSESLGREMRADERAVGLLCRSGFEGSAMERLVARVEAEQPAGWASQRCRRLSEVRCVP